MAEYIFEISEALYDEQTSEAVMKPNYKGELIRCKDCAIRFDSCPMVVRFGSFIQFFTGDGDYCSYGERREDDGTEKTNRPNL